jgi:hypothetical protein
MKKYYTYKLIDPTTDICFYVGKAHDNGYRPKGYITTVQRNQIPNGNNYRLYCYIKYLLSLDISYLIETAEVQTDQEALANELILQQTLNPICNIAKCGEISCRTDRPLSDDHKKKIGLANSKKIRTIAERQKLSEAMRKRIVEGWISPFKNLSEESRKRGGQKLLGRTSPRKGSHLTTDQKEKLRQANLGKTYSEETNKKKGRTNWTDAQDDYITSHSIQESIDHLKRTESSIKNRKHKLNKRISN